MTITITETYEVLEATETIGPYHFKIQVINKEDIKIIIIKNNRENFNLIYGKNYVIEVNSLNKSGYVKFLNNHPQKGEKIVIKRESPMIQQVTFPPNVNFYEQNIELMGDKIVLQNQEIANNVKRSLKFPIDLKDKETELPYPAPGKSLIWNQDGKKLINSIISADGAYKSPVPNPNEGNYGNLLRINNKKTSYELFDIGIKEPNNGEPNQILRISEDKKRYEFSSIPKFLKPSDEDIGKTIVLSKKDEFIYVNSNEKELVAILEFEKELTRGKGGDLVRYSDGSYSGTKYELKFTYDKLDLKDYNVVVSLYLLSSFSVKTLLSPYLFAVEVLNLPQKYQDFKTEFNFKSTFKVADAEKIYQITKSFSGNSNTQVLIEALFPIQLKLKASIYKPLF